jgi:phospholipid/cholesterol/gamma-HCH transport system substrate-binding protein|nr:MlaD family protein [Kofleriaceae bacterium]
MAGEARGLEFRVGLLVLVATAILVGFIFVLGNFSLRSGFTLYADFDYVGSLQPGAPIKVSGIKVGKVENVEFLGGQMDDKLHQRVQVRVQAWIEDRAHDSVRSDCEVFINTAGVLGEQYLEIVPGKDWDHPPIAEGTVIHGPPQVHDPPRTDLVVAKLYEVLDGVASVLHDDKDNIKNLLVNGADAIANADKLLVDNRDKLGELIGNGADLTKQATQTLQKVNAGLGDGKPVAALIADADGTLVAAKKTMQDITPPATALLTDATRVTGLVTEQRLDKALTVADNASQAIGKAGGLIDNVNGMVSDLRAGKGTAGGLLAKDDVYADLREMIRDLKRNPWKLFWKE